MPGGLRQVLIHSEISFLRLSVGCEANHFSASLAVAISCRAEMKKREQDGLIKGEVRSSMV